jgi:hypothetical protein
MKYAYYGNKFGKGFPSSTRKEQNTYSILSIVTSIANSKSNP